MLTKRQKQIFDFVVDSSKKTGVSPTIDEIRKHFHLNSVGTIHQHLEALRLKGYLNKLKYQTRSLDIAEKRTTVPIPILGIIAAGQPIEALETSEESIVVARGEIGWQGKHYALRVQGNSMVDEGIFDGDVVVIRKQEVAENGQTVVAIIDDNEATLKKLYRENGRFRLQPANPTLFPIYRDEVEVRGVVVKVIRNLESQLDQGQSKNEKYVRKIDYSWDYR